jgi:ATP-dependent HslUV protease subunit HslV
MHFYALERFEAKPEKHQGHSRARAIEPHQGSWTDRVDVTGGHVGGRRPRSLIDHHRNGDVLVSQKMALSRLVQAVLMPAGSGRVVNTELSAQKLSVKKSLEIVRVCIYTNMNHTIETSLISLCKPYRRGPHSF